jgi:hypothetical protein
MTDTPASTQAKAVHQVFHAPELWVILRTLGVFAPGTEAPPELGRGAVRTAQAELLRRGAVLVDAEGRLSLAPEIDALVWPAAFPETVFIASVTDHTQAEPVEQQACFSWTKEALVVNWVDEAQDHHFAAYHPMEVQDTIWDHLSGWVELEVDEPDAAAANVTAEAIERSVEGLQRAVLLTAVSQLGAPEQTAQALSWWVSGRSAWLMQNSDPSGPVMLRPVGRGELGAAVFEFVEAALGARATVAR